MKPELFLPLGGGVQVTITYKIQKHHKGIVSESTMF